MYVDCCRNHLQRLRLSLALQGHLLSLEFTQVTFPRQQLANFPTLSNFNELRSLRNNRILSAALWDRSCVVSSPSQLCMFRLGYGSFINYFFVCECVYAVILLVFILGWYRFFVNTKF